MNSANLLTKAKGEKLISFAMYQPWLLNFCSEWSNASVIGFQDLATAKCRYLWDKHSDFLLLKIKEN